MWRFSVICLALTSAAYAASSVVNYPGEVITSPRSGSRNLLFPFVTNIAGYDTQITISNTSQDTFGTAPQSGRCTIFYYGASVGGGAAPPAQTTPRIPAGGQVVFSVSQGGSGLAATPGFQGYIFAVCGFALARGTARIVALSTPFAAGEEAQAVSLPRSSEPFSALLLPFVTNQAGLDTAIVISNTSVDPFGDTPAEGNCSFYFYGSTTGGGAAPPPVTTSSPVPGGSLAVFTLSNGGNYGLPAVPGFQGYVIALCDFPNAQGYALVTDIAAHRTAMGVTADSIPYPFVRARTHHPLLFSTVSNQNGIDTAISIANTSSDPFGTTPGSGTCTLNYFGSTTGGGAAPPAQTSARVPAGESLVFSLSGGGNYGIAATPGFQGYIFADCTFPLAQGWGFMPIGAASDGDSIAPEIVTTPRPAGSSTLLFSAVSNRSGNDTNITISNTSEDPLGTSPGAGACTISYFGTTSGGGSAPPPQTSSSIAAGGQLSFSLSHGNAAQGVAATPGFQGYMIADCSFPDAQGIAEVTQVPGQLAATHALSRDAQNNVVVNVQLFNTGGTTVPTALITVAKIGSTNATSIPANPVDIPPGTSVQETVVFPASVGTSGTHAVLKIDGTYVGGSFDFTSNVTLP